LFSYADAAEIVLSKCITTVKKPNGTYVKKYHLEFLEDFRSKSLMKRHKDKPKK